MGGGLQLAVQPDSNGQYTELEVVLSFAGYDDGQEIYSWTPDNFQTTALIDSGTSWMSLTDDLYNGLLEVLGFESTQNGWFIECDTLRNSEYSVAFGFGGITDTYINVPFGNFADNVTDDNGDPKLTSTGNTICSPAFEGGSDRIILGDTFMKAAYTVFNLDEKYVWIAQANYNSKSNIVALGGDTPSLKASATGTASAVVTGTGLPDNNLPSQTASAVPSDISFTQASYTPTGTKVSGAAKTDDATSSTSTGAAATAGLDVAKAVFGAALAGLIAV